MNCSIAYCIASILFIVDGISYLANLQLLIDMVTNYSTYSTIFIFLMFIIILLFTITESLNIALVVLSTKIRKSHPEKMKKLMWICHFLSLILIIPSFIVILFLIIKSKIYYSNHKK